ncbi:MAG: hypothetical protein ACI33K_13590 [Clostridiaceae bacterium]
MSTNFSEDMREAMMKGSSNMEGAEREVWKNISLEISKREEADKREETMKKKNDRFMWVKVGTAAALAIIILAATDPGQTAIAKFKEFFAPEKQITQELEGDKEETDLQLNESKMGYIMYYDSERYTLRTEGDKDIIESIYNGSSEVQLPDVFMEIYQQESTTIEEEVAKLEQELSKIFPEVTKEEETDPVKGIMIKGKEGNDFDSIIVKYHVLDNTKGGVFIIKEQYFLEAAEGHGARFTYMLREFQIVDGEEKSVVPNK